MPDELAAVVVLRLLRRGRRILRDGVAVVVGDWCGTNTEGESVVSGFDVDVKT